MFCSQCRSQLVAGSRFCPRCGASSTGLNAQPLVQALPPQIVVMRSDKSAGLAAVLSFFWCGLGQIYNGQIGKGLCFGFLYLLSFVLIFALVGIITTPLLWIWGMVDAYGTSERINREVASGARLPLG
jgi:TM2 domain-containing membrane protein YozV